MALVVEPRQLVDDERRRPHPRHRLEILDDAAAPVELRAHFALDDAAGAQPAGDLVVARAHRGVAGRELQLDGERGQHLLVRAALLERLLDARRAVVQRRILDLAGRQLLGVPQGRGLLELLVGLFDVAAIEIFA